MIGMVSHISKPLLALLLCALLFPGSIVFAPSDAQAFGGLAENGTAQFMGIGVTPQKILHVSGSGPGSVPLFQRGSDSAGFIIERTSTNRWVLGVNESPALGNGFVLSTIPTGNTSIPRLMITPAGKVGIGTTAPNSQLHVAGPIATAYKSVTNSTSSAITYTVSDNDSIISCDPNGDNIFVTLPVAAGCIGRTITVKCNSAGGNVVYVQVSGGGTIDDSSQQVLATPQCITVFSDGTQWCIMAWYYPTS